MKLLKYKQISGQIRVVTGLHIGAGNDSIEIGGMDNPIIKHPITSDPYIPGSSLKGKVRSLMEWKLDRVRVNRGQPCNCGKCDICRVFGTSAGRKDDFEAAEQRGPSRLIIRDAFISEESKLKFYSNSVQLVEEKHENSLNRISAEANPRPIERVVPGVEFDFELVFRVLDMGDNGAKDEELFESVVKDGLRQLESDYLGGGGSRGNGKIQFVNLKDETGAEILL